MGGFFFLGHRRSSESKETLEIIQSASLLLEMGNQGSEVQAVPKETCGFMSRARTRSSLLPPRPVPLKRRAHSLRCLVQGVLATSPMLCQQLFPWGTHEISKQLLPVHPKYTTCPFNTEIRGGSLYTSALLWAKVEGKRLLG